MAGGRPSSYTEETIDKALGYIDGAYELQGEAFPTVEGLTNWLDITRSTMHDWRTDETKKEFASVVEKLLSKQSMMLISGSIKSEYNATIAKLLLSKHGYSEKIETESKIDSTNTTTHQLSITDAARYIDFIIAKSRADNDVIEHDQQKQLANDAD